MSISVVVTNCNIWLSRPAALWRGGAANRTDKLTSRRKLMSTVWRSYRS